MTLSAPARFAAVAAAAVAMSVAITSPSTAASRHVMSGYKSQATCLSVQKTYVSSYTKIVQSCSYGGSSLDWFFVYETV